VLHSRCLLLQGSVKAIPPSLHHRANKASIATFMGSESITALIPKILLVRMRVYLIRPVKTRTINCLYCKELISFLSNTPSGKTRMRVFQTY
jgi:hypothetical protein